MWNNCGWIQGWKQPGLAAVHLPGSKPLQATGQEAGRDLHTIPRVIFPVKSSSLRYQSARPARLMQAPISRLGRRRRQVFLKSLGVATEKVRTVSPDCPALPSPRRSPPGCCELSRGYSRGAYLLWKPGPPSRTNPHPKLRLDLLWLRGTWFKPLQCSLPWSPQRKNNTKCDDRLRAEVR